MPRVIRDCGNPLLRDWMEEWMEEAKALQSKSYYTFKKAFDSLSACPMTFQHPSEAQQLDGIGPKLAIRLEKRMIKYCEDNGLPVPTRQKGKRRSTNDTSEALDDSNNKRRKRAPRAYIPRLRTGPYAILMTLLDFKDEGIESATKMEIVRKGQNYCDASLDLAEPGSNYTAWSGIKILKEKSYVWQNGSPPRFTLTETGESMAQHLRTATFNNGNGSPSRRKYTPRLAQQAESDDDEDDDDGPAPVDLSLYVSNPEEFLRERGVQTPTPSLTSVAHTPAANTTKKPAHHHTINFDASDDDDDDEPTIDLSLYVLDPDAYRQKNSTSISNSRQQTTTNSDNNHKVDTNYMRHGSTRSTLSQSNDMEVITLLSPSPPPSPSIRSHTQNVDLWTSDSFEYTYLDTMDNPVRHLSQAAIEIDEVHGCLMYKIRFLSQQSGHFKARKLKNIDRNSWTGYFMEQDADLVCPGLPARTLLPLHTDQHHSQDDFWPETAFSTQQSHTSTNASQGLHSSSQSAIYNQRQDSPRTSGSRNDNRSTEISPSSSSSTTTTTPLAMDMSTMVSIAKEDGLVWLPNEYTIMMVLDNREVKMKSNREYIQDKLEEKGVSVVKRALDLGDIIWVAKHVETGEEMYLDIVVERKRMDDLVSSVKDGRFREQKYRLKQSGSRKIFYVIEEYNKEAALKFGAQAIQTAISSVQAIDRFYLKRTNNLDETINYLVRLTKMIEQLYKNIKLQEIPTRLINKSNYITLKNELSPPGPTISSTHYVIPYTIYNQLNSKSGTSTLQDLYIKMLMTIRGVNAEKAQSLIRVYPTPYHLFKAMDEAGDNAKQLATRATKNGITRRRWPSSASERLWEVWGKHHSS
ncbi:hypothetical protein BC941DRAFT_419916 [Chlamydoabsidia padenii]|nr:hypothetical protein BC941DRAFT_419916 [Chlamydoabsidia padenii]